MLLKGIAEALRTVFAVLFIWISYRTLVDVLFASKDRDATLVLTFATFVLIPSAIAAAFLVRRDVRALRAKTGFRTLLLLRSIGTALGILLASPPCLLVAIEWLALLVL